ncbi:hypothetical protein RCG17_06800 [Neobacillus sp. PS3-12]|uniref:hypothetical protein n=1 Tax=Neobacillus sp. PS3-12 TaxID=3070677 RepID=UPI0027E0F6BC|nr:hypothetical protein [Neobacillus sp. PS3-12]WML54349.1 hypothetical protein RCG17_06800 [Neobacillus sp. PS3-12]
MIVSVNHADAAAQSIITNVQFPVILGIFVINARVPAVQSIMIRISTPVSILNVHEVIIGT